MGLSIDALVDEMKDVAVNAGSTHNQLLFAVLLIKIWAGTQKELTKRHVRTAKPQINLRISKVHMKKKALGLWLIENWQTAKMRLLIQVSAGLIFCWFCCALILWYPCVLLYCWKTSKHEAHGKNNPTALNT